MNDELKNNSSKNPIEAGLSPHLFWDVNKENLDWGKNIRLIVERVIERGTYKNLLLIENIYGREKLIDTVKQISYMNPKDMMFVHAYYNIPLEQLKCYAKKPLNPNFLN